MAYSGTQVTTGRGIGLVVATGMHTELGRIATLLQSVESEDTPLQARLDRVGKQLALVGLVVAGLVVVMGALGGETASDLVLTAISVAVAVIPEGLPAVVTFTLAIGSQRMLRRQALIRKLPAVETLGSVTVICSDKTGTLTQNKMAVTMLDVADHEIVIESGLAADVEALPGRSPCDARCVGAVQRRSGSAMTSTVSSSCSVIRPRPRCCNSRSEAGVDIEELRARIARIGENPFDSARKRMSTVHDPIAGASTLFAGLPQDRPISFVKGAIDGLVEHAAGVWSRRRSGRHGRRMATSPPRRQRPRWPATVDGSSALRTACTTRPSRSRPIRRRSPPRQRRELVVLGLVGMIDPPRTEVARCGRRVPKRRYPARDDHRRPSADGEGDRRGARHRHRRTGAHRRRPRPA